MYRLLVTDPFKDYKRGDIISDHKEIMDIMDSEDAHRVIKIAAEEE